MFPVDRRGHGRGTGRLGLPRGRGRRIEPIQPLDDVHEITATADKEEEEILGGLDSYDRNCNYWSRITRMTHDVGIWGLDSDSDSDPEEPQPAAIATASSSSSTATATIAQLETEKDIYKDWNPMAQVFNSPFNLPDSKDDMLVTTVGAAPAREGAYCEFAKATSNSSSTSTIAQPDEDIYKDWNPMAQVFNSAFNLPDSKDDMLVTTVGAPAREGIYCEFDLEPGSKYCWKTWRCHRPHRPNNVPEPKYLDEPDEVDIPKDASTKATVMLFDGFPRQRTCPQGIYFVAKVVHVINPHEFYIIPETDVTCICKKNISEGINVANNAGNPSFNHSGLTSFDNTMKDIQRDLNFIATIKQHNFYSQSEAVAAKVQLADKSMEWRRAVVTTESQITHNSAELSQNFGIPLALKYGLTLMDSGEKVICSIIDMAPLPMIYANMPPYAYKCALYGILPVCDVWCSKSVSHFKTLVEQKQVLVEVQRTSFSNPPPQGSGRAGIFSERPYEVGLRVKDQDAVAANHGEVWKSVEKELLETFRAVPINLQLAAIQRQVALQKQK